LKLLNGGINFEQKFDYTTTTFQVALSQTFPSLKSNQMREILVQLQGRGLHTCLL